MDDRTPPGERDVFNLLAAGPEAWLAFHGLDLTPWNQGRRTEIDFVVVIPDTGILCLEIKSHDNITFDGHRWYPETITRSPFKQASDGRHTFYRRLAELAPQFRKVPVVHCCIFPRATFDMPRNLSVQSWELMDMRCFRQFKSADDFCSDLRNRVVDSIDADTQLSHLDRALTVNDTDTIVKCCVPVQKYRPEAREEIKRREVEIARILRVQQEPVLRLAALNDRLMVSGGAGTGKTLIAMEVACRAAQDGRRVALLCFNQLVGNWMKGAIEKQAPLPNLVTGRTIRVLADLTEISITAEATRNFWERELPEKLEERLTSPDFRACALFDYLVLDEAQDVLARPRLWQCLLQFLKGGLDCGSFALFGDFENQVLAERVPMRQALAELDARSRPVQWRLSENCRNYRIVGETAVRLAGLDSVYTGYLRSGGAINNYDIFFYDNESLQLEKIKQWITEFKAQGFQSSDITLLSFRADHASAASQMQAVGYKLRPAWQAGPSPRYSSVHSFKGMESKVVILTDVAIRDQGFERDLFYAGITRATESVRVLCDVASRTALFEWIEAGENR